MRTHHIAGLLAVAMQNALLFAACGGTPDSVGTSPAAQTNEPVRTSDTQRTGSAGGLEAGTAAPSTSGTSDAGAQAPTKSKKPAGDDDDDDEKGDDKGDDSDDGDTTDDKGGSRRSLVGDLCCFEDKFLECPDSKACFGGFNLDVCLDRCDRAGDSCWNNCFSKLDSAPPPKGCIANVEPPAGAECVNGTINIGNGNIGDGEP